MPKTEDGPLGPDLAARLRAELDRVEPRYSTPRYLSANDHRGLVAWRLAPGLLAAALVGIFSLSAWAATGSANPVVWTERAMSVIRHAQPSPTPQSSPSPSEQPAAPAAAPTQEASPEPKESAEPSGEPASGESPQPTQSPEPRDTSEPSGDHSGSGETTSSPSPTPSDH